MNLFSSYIVEHFSGQDSFEILRGQTSRNDDIELGSQAPKNPAELGLEGFFKQVSISITLPDIALLSDSVVYLPSIFKFATMLCSFF